MRKQHFALVMFASLMAISTAAAQKLDWEAVERITINAPITVITQKRTHCNFKSASEEQLFCEFTPTDWLSFEPHYYEKRRKELVFDRADVREVRIEPNDWSAGYLALILGVGGGGGWDANHQPTGFSDFKIGGPFALDLQYDRIQGMNGFATAGSAVIPVFKIPPPKGDYSKMFARLYAEPGLGYRAGGGSFGGYSSAKVILVFFSVPKWADSSPYIEFERRFPFGSPLQGDNRVTIGVMMTVCQTCSF